MLAAIILIFCIFAWLGHRALTRIVIPELAEKRREQFRNYGPYGDWPAVPSDLKFQHDQGNTR